MTKMTPTAKTGRRTPVKQAPTTFLEDSPLGPFINAKPRLLPRQRFEMGLNIFVEEPAMVQLTSSDPNVVTVPDELAGSPDYSSVMFDIVGRAVGNATITATLGEFSVTTPVRVVEDHTDIASLGGLSPDGYAGQFVYELGMTDGEMSIGLNGPVIDERIATISSDTPEVVSVPESILIPGHTNWPQSFPLQLHNVGTSRIKVTSNGVTLETVIEVIPPVLRIASIEPPSIRVKPGDDVDVTITMTEETVCDIVLSLVRRIHLDAPRAVMVPKGKRSVTFRFHVREDFQTGDGPLGIRWRNSQHGVGVYL